MNPHQMKRSGVISNRALDPIQKLTAAPMNRRTGPKRNMIIQSSTNTERMITVAMARIPMPVSIHPTTSDTTPWVRMIVFIRRRFLPADPSGARRYLLTSAARQDGRLSPYRPSALVPSRERGPDMVEESNDLVLTEALDSGQEKERLVEAQVRAGTDSQLPITGLHAYPGLSALRQRHDGASAPDVVFDRHITAFGGGDLQGMWPMPRREIPTASRRTGSFSEAMRSRQSRPTPTRITPTNRPSTPSNAPTMMLRDQNPTSRTMAPMIISTTPAPAAANEIPMAMLLFRRQRDSASDGRPGNVTLPWNSKRCRMLLSPVIESIHTEYSGGQPGTRTRAGFRSVRSSTRPSDRW